MADPVESLSAYGRARAKIHSESRPCMRHGVSRRNEHLYFAAETLAPKRRLLNLHGPRVDSRDSIVPDNHKKFAIAVTSARVDPRVFLSLSLPLCAPRIILMRETCELYRQMGCQRDKAHSNPAVTAAGNLPFTLELYALSMKIPCRFSQTLTLDLRPAD